MIINRRLGVIHLKIVYYGPGLSGKTTNLEIIHAHTNPKMRGDLTSLKTGEDRTLFLDFLQLELGTINGLTPKFGIYTVPGQTYYGSTRKAVLRGADGVVFVADSRRHCLTDNQDRLAELKNYLQTMGHLLDDFPYILQCNKQDLPGVLYPSELRAQLGQNGVQCIASVATQGVGVFETLGAIVKETLRELK